MNAVQDHPKLILDLFIGKLEAVIFLFYYNRNSEDDWRIYYMMWYSALFAIQQRSRLSHAAIYFVKLDYDFMHRRIIEFSDNPLKCFHIWNDCMHGILFSPTSNEQNSYILPCNQCYLIPAIKQLAIQGRVTSQLKWLVIPQIAVELRQDKDIMLSVFPELDYVGYMDVALDHSQIKHNQPGVLITTRTFTYEMGCFTSNAYTQKRLSNHAFIQVVKKDEEEDLCGECQEFTYSPVSKKCAMCVIRLRNYHLRFPLLPDFKLYPAKWFEEYVSESSSSDSDDDSVGSADDDSDSDYKEEEEEEKDEEGDITLEEIEQAPAEEVQEAVAELRDIIMRNRSNRRRI